MPYWMRRSQDQVEDIEENLKELDQFITRLRVAYEQYFTGALKREPLDLRAKAQKIITRFMNQPPRNSGYKFRFNQLNAKYQIYRQLWGRTVRQIEAGTYRPHLYRSKKNEQSPAATSSSARKAPAPKAASGIQGLHDALAAARRKTGERGAELSPEKLSRIVRQQTEALRKQHGKGKVRFRVVIENNRAKLKASMSKS
jgi:hypothetical protein